MTISMITTYQGRNVDELTRDEAIAALKKCSGEMRDMLEIIQRSNRVFGMLLDHRSKATDPA